MEPLGLMKKCRVCGDRALAFNFNGLSCESCKAFFRRNALRQSELSCLQSGQCVIDIGTRKFCPSCRLNKCFMIGMKKELVMAREEKYMKRKKILKTVESGDLFNKLDCEQTVSNDQQIILGKLEQKRFDELERASLAFQTQTIRSFESYIQMVNNFCHQIESFGCLKSSDQMQIINCFCNTCLIIISTTKFSPESHFLSSTVDMNLINSLKNEIDNDLHIRNLLIVISLFRTKSNVTCPEFLRYHYFVYCHLLYCYLEYKYQCQRIASQKYSVLLQLMDQLWNIEQLWETSFPSTLSISNHRLNMSTETIKIQKLVSI